ncbi:MAG: NAD(P)H-hydrate dehydratase [Clostridia bacterium]|nr:NAD(P)H-hydrate dehydratase [Clostridia bacterium]
MEQIFITKEQVAAHLQKRNPDSHKGTYGHVLSLCGSYGMAGAAYFAGAAALRSGAGLLTMAIPSSIYPIVTKMLPEALCLPLEEDLTPLQNAIFGKQVLLAGCGLGQSEESTKRLYCLLEHRKQIPLVLDADGLNWLSNQKTTPLGLQTEHPLLCLTPHPAEMARLLHTSTEEVQQNRVPCAQQLATRYNAIVVLKGHHTVVASPDGQVFLNPTGCSGMATGGSGDVLTGIIGSLIAQGLSVFDAAICGVYLHGLAGEKASTRLSEHGMLPSDMLLELAMVFKDFE